MPGKTAAPGAASRGAKHVLSDAHGRKLSGRRALARLHRMLETELSILERSQPHADDQDWAKRARWVEATKKLADLLNDMDQRALGEAREKGEPRDRDALRAALERRLAQLADAECAASVSQEPERR